MAAPGRKQNGDFGALSFSPPAVKDSLIWRVTCLSPLQIRPLFHVHPDVGVRRQNSSVERRIDLDCIQSFSLVTRYDDPDFRVADTHEIRCGEGVPAQQNIANDSRIHPRATDQEGASTTLHRCRICARDLRGGNIESV